jgi:Flp pilus assembly protein TadG
VQIVKNECGSILVLATLMVTLLLVMVGMGLDTGWLTFGRSQGQRAVDAAALAGAAGLAKGDTSAIEKNIEALNATNDYVRAAGNSIDGSTTGKNVMLVRYNPTTGEIIPELNPDNANGVRVALEKTSPAAYGSRSSDTSMNLPLFLMPLLSLMGFNTSPTTDINVSAVAVYSAIPGIPLALGGCTPSMVDQSINFDQTPSGGPDMNNSGWTTYNVNETNVPDLTKRIRAIVNCQGGGTAKKGDPICLGNGADTAVMPVWEELADPTGNTCYFTPVVAPQKSFTGCTGAENIIQAWAKICIKHVCAPTINPANPSCEKGKKYIVARVESCDLPDTARVGQCFRHSLVREPQAGM